MTRAAAILCARNEELHIRACLSGLIAEGLDVVLIDHASTDRTLDHARGFLGHGLLAIEHMPWSGGFSLTEQLRAKQRVIEILDHDWVLHVDADEWPVSPDPAMRLLDVMALADRAGCNCLNFLEFCFVPLAGEMFAVDHHRALMRRYYFYQRHYPMLMRAFRRDAGFDMAAGAGHSLSGGPVRRYPTDMILRHYIVLSNAQARRKYLGRPFAEEELAKGWHRARSLIQAEDLCIQPHPALLELATPASRDFVRDRPMRTHFWQWRQDEA